MLTPEQHSRQNIDDQLIKAGWIVQDFRALNLSAGLGIAIREYPTESGSADYILFVDRKPTGVIEAEKAGVIFGISLLFYTESNILYGK